MASSQAWLAPVDRIAGRIPVYRKGALLVLVPLIFQFLLIGAFTSFESQYDEIVPTLVDAERLRRQLEKLAREITQSQAAVRGYVLSGNAAFIELGGVEEGALESSCADIEMTLRDRDLHTGNFARVRALVAEWRARRDADVNLVRTGQGRQAADRIASREGDKIVSEVRRLLEAMGADEDALILRQHARIAELRNGRGGAVVVALTASLISTVFLWAVFSVGLNRRLATLVQNSERLSAGKELLPPAGGSDELAQVDGAFHAMAASLTKSRNDLEQRTLLLEAILSSMGEGVAVADREGNILLRNAAAARITSDQQIDSVNERWLEGRGYFHADGLTPYQTDELPLWRAIRGEYVDGEEMRLWRSSDQSGTWINVTGRPLHRGDASEPWAAMAVFRDVTLQKEAEILLREMNQKLERQVLERTAELTETNRELVEKNQENEMFVYSVSHDLRSPLVNLQGFSKELSLTCQDLRKLLETEGVPDTVHRRGRELLENEMAESVRFIQTGVLRLSNIIDSLLRLSRAGRLEYRPQSLDMNAILRRIADSESAALAERGATIEVKDLAPAWGDPTAIEQLFANLINNAIKYLDPKRPGAIVVGCDEPTISGASGMTKYFVSDNGLGIGKNYQEKIFQAFQRVHADVASGDGMGLAIVRRIVERHHGKIWVESEPGHGSAFFLTLPAARARRPGRDMKGAYSDGG